MCAWLHTPLCQNHVCAIPSPYFFRTVLSAFQDCLPGYNHQAGTNKILHSFLEWPLINFLSRITSEKSGGKSLIGASWALHVITYKILVDTVRAGSVILPYLKAAQLACCRVLAEVTWLLSQKQRPLLLTVARTSCSFGLVLCVLQVPWGQHEACERHLHTQQVKLQDLPLS